MAHAFIDDRTQTSLVLFRAIRGHIAQRTDSRKNLGQSAQTIFALAPPSIVSATRVLVLNHGIAYHEPHLAGDGEKPEF